MPKRARSAFAASRVLPFGGTIGLAGKEGLAPEGMIALARKQGLAPKGTITLARKADRALAPGVASGGHGSGRGRRARSRKGITAMTDSAAAPRLGRDVFLALAAIGWADGEL